MTTTELGETLINCSKVPGVSMTRVLANVMAYNFTPLEIMMFKKEFDAIVDRKLENSISANSLSHERAIYIRNYLNGDLFTNDGDYEKNKPCQIINAQAIIDATQDVLERKAGR